MGYVHGHTVDWDNEVIYFLREINEVRVYNNDVMLLHLRNDWFTKVALYKSNSLLYDSVLEYVTKNWFSKNEGNHVVYKR